MSALRSKADLDPSALDFRLVPLADVAALFGHVRIRPCPLYRRKRTFPMAIADPGVVRMNMVRR